MKVTHKNMTSAKGSTPLKSGAKIRVKNTNKTRTWKAKKV